jgi:ELP3 family radical SAM enzyme/protein acetyltransferase
MTPNKITLPVYTIIIKELHKKISNDEVSDIDEYMKKTVPKKFKITPRKDVLTHTYQRLIADGTLAKHNAMDIYFVKLPVRSWSGVLVVTIVLRPDKFSCPYDCKYCPNETIKNGATYDMPRSYLSSEPAVMRAMEVDFDIVKQFRSRVNTLRENGHEIDKVEIIILGGTFSSYPRDYQYEAMRDIFYAANTQAQQTQAQQTQVQAQQTNAHARDRSSLQTEQHLNADKETTLKIIGISLETRPDQINKHELRRFREYGCTRIQIGVQHTDDEILNIVNRQHDVACSIKAIKLIKDYGFKVDIHIMPDLPGATPEKDKLMFDEIFSTTKFCPDYIKIYPCLDVTYTEIRKWKEDGRWKPYSELNGGKELIDLILYAKKQLIPKWIRINRIQRDFPEEHTNNEFKGYLSDTHKSNLRQLLDNKMKKDGVSCKCIRCREIKNYSYDMRDVRQNIMTYEASGGVEKFISYDDNKNDRLLGFVRLRLPYKNTIDEHFIPALRGAALIRELHVYGGLKRVATTTKKEISKPQHNGFGKRLVIMSEIIAWWYGYKSMAIISGVGVRAYYSKLGYELKDSYMVKKLTFLGVLYTVLRFIMKNTI